jgi:hypothetical protein
VGDLDLHRRRTHSGGRRIRASAAAGDAEPGAARLRASAADGRPGGWQSFPPGTVFIDEQEKHGGKHRFDSNAPRPVPESSRRPFPACQSISVARRSSCAGGCGARAPVCQVLWLRQDAADAPLAFVDMSSAPQVGNSWERYSISFPLNGDARALVFGVRLVGQGKSWADDLELLVDGNPSPKHREQNRAATVLEQDQQFTAGSGLAPAVLTTAQLDALFLSRQGVGLPQYPPSGRHPWSEALGFRAAAQTSDNTRRERERRSTPHLVEWIDIARTPRAMQGLCDARSE